MQKVLKVFKRISMEIIVYYQLDKDEETPSLYFTLKWTYIWKWSLQVSFTNIATEQHGSGMQSKEFASWHRWKKIRRGVAVASFVQGDKREEWTKEKSHRRLAAQGSGG